MKTHQLNAAALTDLAAPILASVGEARNPAAGTGATARAHATAHAPAHDALLTIVISLERLFDEQTCACRLQGVS